MKLFVAGAIALTLIAASAGAFAKSNTGTMMTGGPKVVVKIISLNGSGESGVARLWAQGNKTVVSVKIKGEPNGATQPAHIHFGTCAKLNPVPRYPLTSVVDGKSMTTVDAPLASLTKGTMSINVHQGVGAMIKTYVACGTIGAK